jgi:hypothetical protein
MQLDDDGKIVINSSNCIHWSLCKDNLYTDIYNLTPGGVQDREIKFPYLVLFTVFSFYFSLNKGIQLLELIMIFPSSSNCMLFS